jgi:hypothetical protein
MAMEVKVVSMLNKCLVSSPTTLLHNNIQGRKTPSHSSYMLIEKHTMFTAEAPPFFQIQGHKQMERTTPTPLVMKKKPSRSSKQPSHS